MAREPRLIPTRAVKLAANRINSSLASAEIAAGRRSLSGYIALMGKRRGDEGDLQDNAFSRVFDALVPWAYERHVNVNLAGPPGIGKSTRARLMLEWALGRNPLLRTIVASGTQGLAETVVAAVRKSLVARRYKELFPEVRLGNQPTAQEPRMGFERGRFWLLNSRADPTPAMEAVALETVEEMRRVDVGLFDDIVGGEIANSPTMRDHRCRAFFETWVNGRLKNPEGDGWAFAIQNIYHKSDLAHRLLKDPRFWSLWFGVSEDNCSLFLRSWNTPEGAPWPEELRRVAPRGGADDEFLLDLPDGHGWTPESLDRAERGDPALYRRKYRLVAATDEDRMFPGFANVAIPPTLAGLMQIGDPGRGDPRRIVLLPQETARFAFAWGYDMASAKRPGDVLVLLGMNSQGLIFPVEVHFGTAWAPADVAEIIQDAHERGLRPSAVRVESNAIQDKIVQGIKVTARGRSLPWWPVVQGTVTGANKSNPELGLPAVNAEMAAGNIAWPLDAAGSSPDWKRLSRELAECPRFLKPGETPDGPMAFWFAYMALKERGPASANSRIEALTSDVERYEW